MAHKNRYENYLHCDNMFGIQSIKYLYVAVKILPTHEKPAFLPVMENIISNKSPYPLKLFPYTNGEIIRERYRTGFPAAGDIIHRERHTEPTGMVYSRFFSA